jgi:hypothetical protein
MRTQKREPVQTDQALSFVRRKFDEACQRSSQLIEQAGRPFLCADMSIHPAISESAIGRLGAYAGLVACRRFREAQKAPSPSVQFLACFNFYTGAVAYMAQRLFTELKQAGVSQADAYVMTRKAIRENQVNIGIWIIGVCDINANPIAQKRSMRGWKAPRYVGMFPAGEQPYDEAGAEQRLDAKVSEKLIRDLKQKHSQIVERGIDDLIGLVALKATQKRAELSVISQAKKEESAQTASTSTKVNQQEPRAAHVTNKQKNKDRNAQIWCIVGSCSLRSRGPSARLNWTNICW